MSAETIDNYVPFGVEWENEMNKFPKTMLIRMLGKALQSNKESEELLATSLNEMKRYLPILESLEKNEPNMWDFLTQGTGIATLNGYRNAIAKAKGDN